MPLLIGGMFVATAAYLAAVFLVGDARRAGDDDLEAYFVRRALAAAAVAGAAGGRRVWSTCTPKRATSSTGSPTRACRWSSSRRLCGLGVLALLLRRRAPGRLRPLAGGAVVAVIWGWGVAQFPYLLPTRLRIDEAAAPGPTLDVVLVVFAIAAVLVLPSLGLLYALSQRDMLGE